MPRYAGSTTRALACMIGLCLAHAGSAQPIQLMTGGDGKLIYLPAILADQLGYFRREGLEVRLLSAPAGIDTSTELIAGAIVGALGFYDHTIELQSHGMDVQSVVVLNESAGLVELGRRDSGMQSMADARGRRLAVTGFGSSTFYLTRFLAAREGVAADAYTLVPVATGAAFEKAITERSVDAGMVEEPTATLMMSRLPVQPLVDMRSVADTRTQLGGPYAGACLYLRREWIDAHHDETTRLVRAMVDALHFIQSHSAREIAAVVPASLKGGEASIYLQALAMTRPTYSATGKMPAGAPSTVLSVLAHVDPDVSARHVDIARTYTDRFVDAAPGAASRNAAADSL
ncbi:ABC transporter substrate-binding protein [Paraburkholderia sp. BCC1884]|uniref:ABC transporter substrate-binding protein n=1 Tax=Paraburkholderia sp. BCC1884 TaxID=2562668 RepID=UPI001182882D|nr:ABC transporter substrate-binding protein [Paraburkholderia sp. BCC1884]